MFEYASTCACLKKRRLNAMNSTHRQIGLYQTDDSLFYVIKFFFSQINRQPRLAHVMFECRKYIYTDKNHTSSHTILAPVSFQFKIKYKRN